MKVRRPAPIKEFGSTRVAKIGTVKASPNNVFIGRPSFWGNRYIIGIHGTREECVEKHKRDVLADPQLIERIKRELKGKTLICFCTPRLCHGDTLAQIAEGRLW